MKISAVNKRSSIAFALLMSAFYLIPNVAQAADGKTCCLCAPGNNPGYQVPIFKAGCMAWLHQQSGCDVSESVPDFKSLDVAAAACKNGTVKLGYVGHGIDDTSALIFKEYIAKVTDPTGLAASVEFDNTSCLALANAPAVKRYIDSVPVAPGKYIRVAGSQTISVGEFNNLLPGVMQINASVDTRTKLAKFPRCSKVENAPCWDMQHQEDAYCTNDDHSYTRLTCTTAPDPHGYIDNDISIKKEPYRWTAQEKVSASELFAAPKNVYAPGTYECFSSQGSKKVRITFRESSDGIMTMEINDPNSSLKTNGTLVSSSDYFAHFKEFTNFSLNSGWGIWSVDIWRETGDISLTWGNRDPAAYGDGKFDRYGGCIKSD